MDDVLFEARDGLAFITINRPKALNALNTNVLAQLAGHLDTFLGDSNLKAAILTGSGEKAFVAGADIKELINCDAQSGQNLGEKGQGLLNRIEQSPKPIIAAVNGFALGGGCELALACTFRICSENAKFGLPEVTLGLIPGYGGTQRLPRIVGKGRALEWILTGDMIDADTAHQTGLVNHVTPQTELMQTAEKIARKMMSRAPLALAQALRAVNQGQSMAMEQALRFEASLFGLCCATQDAKEGLSAFIEKRKANFNGT